MAGNGIEISVDQSSVNRVLRDFKRRGAMADPNLKRIIGETGLRVQADAKREARVMYGFLRSSIYLDYAGRQRKQVSIMGNAPAQRQLIFPRSTETDARGLNFVVGSEMNYAGIIEDRYPYLIPAYNKHTKRAEQAMEKLLKKMTQ
jgi:hypothetical protein